MISPMLYANEHNAPIWLWLSVTRNHRGIALMHTSDIMVQIRAVCMHYGMTVFLWGIVVSAISGLLDGFVIAAFYIDFSFFSTVGPLQIQPLHPSSDSRS